MKSLLSLLLFSLAILSAKAQNLYPSSGNLEMVGGNVRVTNPNAYPYGVNINVTYTGLWVREFGVSYNSSGKMFSFGVLGNDGNVEYGYIGGNTTAEAPYTNPWMVFKANGNVGIGTTNPGAYKLAVEGTIGARKVKVTTLAWADFVFEDKYKLPTLQELEKFIAIHKHLPDIPSAKEVNQEGIELGEMNRKLLQKIEEQVLYIIELNKKVEALTQRLSKLEDK